MLRYLAPGLVTFALLACDSGESSNSDGGGDEAGCSTEDAKFNRCSGDGDGDGDGGDGDSDGDAGDGDGDGDGSAGDGDGDGDGDAGDGDGDGDGSGGDGVVYISQYYSLWKYELSGSEAVQVAELELATNELKLSPGADRLAYGGQVVSTADGTNLIADGAYVSNIASWLDNDTIFFGGGIDFHRSHYDGTNQVVYDLTIGGGSADRHPFSPDRTKIAFKNGSTGAIHIVPVTGPGEETTIGNTLDCSPPMWLGNGAMIGVCINSNEVYIASEGDESTTRYDLGIDADIQDIVLWTGDDRVLVKYGGGTEGGYYQVDSTGTNHGTIPWIAEITHVAFANLQISKDDSRALYTTNSTYMVDVADGGNLRDLSVGGAPLSATWTGAK